MGFPHDEHYSFQILWLIVQGVFSIHPIVCFVIWKENKKYNLDLVHKVHGFLTLLYNGSSAEA